MATMPTSLIVVLTLRLARAAADKRAMPWEVPLPFALFSLLCWAVVGRAMLVYAHKLPPTCRACGLKLERRFLGESICNCGR
jgi:hypothetical protein